ncbi:LysE family transporter [Curvibacter sp. CHRR-16]|uniref:LysE family translocator n=1 Tax=Curvibacter sp. CHRR-16 TaxID=2835872 RepID=UPI001BDAA48A|nr:LysE family transporter [Curvibacter sp. CHRR-16]MBT0570983.1 LysE family transporter [Curvibacter sp. CHRR-16]
MTVLLSIAMLHWVVLITPGANFVLVGQLAASGQRREALAATVGISCVTAAWATLAVLGLGVVFALHPVLRQVAQIAGGLYLLYVAWRMAAARSSGEQATQAVLRGWMPAMRTGFVTNILNPKTALFFSSVFASLLPADAPWQLVVASMVVCYLNSLCWHVLLSLVFSNHRVQRFYATQRQRMNRVCAVLVAAFGAKLLWQVSQELWSLWRTRAAAL